MKSKVNLSTSLARQSDEDVGHVPGQAGGDFPAPPIDRGGASRELFGPRSARGPVGELLALTTTELIDEWLDDAAASWQLEVGDLA